MKKLFLLILALAGRLQAIPGFIEEKLKPNDLQGASTFGSNLAVSADGKTIVVGVSKDNSNMGCAIVFKKQSDGWHQDGHKLIASDTKGAKIYQGSSVAISADGKHIAVGGSGDNDDMGAVWIYDYSDADKTWTQSAKIVASNVNGTEINQGSAVAFADNGRILAIGAMSDSNLRGASFVFKHNGTEWQEQTKLIANLDETNQRQGVNIAMSEDGNTAVVAALYDEKADGAVYVFTRADSKWSQGPKLQCIDSPDQHSLGGVALSADGKTLAIGSPSNGGRKGNVCIFIRSGSQWIQQGERLAGSGVTDLNNAAQGFGVALSRDGKTLLIGGPFDNFLVGATWRFAQIDGSKWLQQGEKITVSDSIHQSQQGSPLAVSGNGNTLVIAGPDDNFHKGAVWVFSKPEEALQPSTNKDYYLSYWIPPLAAIAATVIGFVIKHNLKKYCCTDQNPESAFTIPVAGPRFEIMMDQMGTTR